MSRVAALSLLAASLALPALAAQPTRRPTDDDRGRELYDRHCASCHGPKAKGDGPATAALVAPVPDLAGKVTANPETIDLIQKGRGSMPAFAPTFDRDDARRVAGWMAKVHEQKTRGPAPAPAPAQAEEGPDQGDAQAPPDAGDPPEDGDEAGPG